jgi:2-polyprenyl-3-methyl-5-hydroxy-6-metoxy-1,4-benzoquinol methylase
VVWDAVNALLAGAGEQQVLDIGGGTGGFAVRVAAQGNQVTVIDPSPDALAALARRADEEGVADRVAGVQGDLGNLRELAAEGSVDLVLCHGVLGLVDDPAAALTAIAAVLRPGGALSLLVSQRHAAVLARAMAGHFVQALELLDGDGADQRPSEHRFTPEEVVALLEGAGFTLRSTHGIRVFTDLVPSSLLDLEPGASAALLELERAVSERPEYLTLASQLHVSATR